MGHNSALEDPPDIVDVSRDAEAMVLRDKRPLVGQRELNLAVCMCPHRSGNMLSWNPRALQTRARGLHVNPSHHHVTEAFRWLLVRHNKFCANIGKARIGFVVVLVAVEFQ